MLFGWSRVVTQQRANDFTSQLTNYIWMAGVITATFTRLQRTLIKHDGTVLSSKRLEELIPLRILPFKLLFSSAICHE